LIRSFFGEPSAKLANHRSPVLPLFLRPSTHTRPRAAVSANHIGLGENVRLHGVFEVGLCGTGFEIQLRIERIQLQKNIGADCR
jgi:hypothetical protein